MEQVIADAEAQRARKTENIGLLLLKINELQKQERQQQQEERQEERQQQWKA